VFALANFATISVETVHVWRKRLRQEQLAFVKRSKRDGTSRVRAFMQHELDPVFSGRGNTSARRWLTKSTLVAVQMLKAFEISYEDAASYRGTGQPSRGRFYVSCRRAVAATDDWHSTRVECDPGHERDARAIKRNSGLWLFEACERLRLASGTKGSFLQINPLDGMGRGHSTRIIVTMGEIESVSDLMNRFFYQALQ
jgi:hypothetical protein